MAGDLTHVGSRGAAVGAVGAGRVWSDGRARKPAAREQSGPRQRTWDGSGGRRLDAMGRLCCLGRLLRTVAAGRSRSAGASV